MSSDIGEDQRVYKTRSALDKDLSYLSYNLREADKDEIKSVLGSESYYDALFMSYKHSDFCNVILGEKDLPIFIYGMDEDGTIWALGTNEVTKNKFKFVKTIKECFVEITLKYDKVFNYIDERNELHIRFLKTLGFKLDKKKVIKRKYDNTNAIYFSFNK